MMKAILSFMLFASVTASAAITTKTIEYKYGGKTFEGYVAWPEESGEKEKKVKKPAVLVVHDWMGLTDKTREKAREVAELGYVAMAIDVFGKDVRPKDGKEAGQNAGAYYGDRKMFRDRLTAGYQEMLKQTGVDAGRTGAIGFCFGGTGVMELARTGVGLKGVVSFHGSIDSTNIEDGKKIKAKVLALHGADDPYVSAEKLDGFEKEMKAGKVDWQLVKYGNAVHSFTDKTAGTDNSKGAAYNEKAAKRSWEEMRRFFGETF